MGTIDVRDAVDADADAVAAIFGHYVREAVATFETEPWTPEQWRAKWVDLRRAGWPVLVATSNRISGTDLVATSNDRVVGFAYVAPWRLKPAYRYTVETSVYLAPNARGHGWGRRLCEQLYRQAADAGARELVAVIADTGDDASYRLHTSLGFEPVGVLRRVGFKFDRWIDVRLLQKSLSAPEPAPGQGVPCGPAVSAG